MITVITSLLIIIVIIFFAKLNDGEELMLKSTDLRAKAPFDITDWDKAVEHINNRLHNQTDIYIIKTSGNEYILHYKSAEDMPVEEQLCTYHTIPTYLWLTH